MSTILDEHTSENSSFQPEYIGFTKRVMGTFIELINVWGLQVLLYSYAGFTQVKSQLLALGIVWFTKVFTEKYGKPSIGHFATNALVLNDRGQIPSWKEVLLRNIVWTTILVLFGSTHYAFIFYSGFGEASGDVWAWITMHVSERLLMFIGTFIFLADRICIVMHPKNKSIQDILAGTVVVQND